MKGICFIEPLFHATIEGCKNMTRRIMEPQPIFDTDGAWIGGGSDPRYKNGKRLYLKEPYRVDTCGSGEICIRYDFDKNDVYRRYLNVEAEGIDRRSIDSAIRQTQKSRRGFANKLFMPEWAARHFIRITAVRPERLQIISDEDCLREGVRKHGTFASMYGVALNGSYYAFGNTPREAYAALIDKINGRGAWDSNPYVWVYGYELCENSNQ